METKYIGSITVDSGQAMLGDPCYLDEWKPWNSEVDNFEDHVNKVGEYGYLGACNATLTNNYGELGFGQAVVFNTGLGDGAYPVFAKLDEDGTVMEITIKFITDDEEQY
jgi:hypothetical protein